MDYGQGGAEDYEVRWTDIIFCYFVCARREQHFSPTGREKPRPSVRAHVSLPTSH